MQSTVGKRVAIQGIVGDEKLAARIHQQLLAASPDDPGREVTLVDAKMLPPTSGVQLASASGEDANDVVTASLARRDNYDYLLRGEILADRYGGQSTPNRVTVSWRLMSLDLHKGRTSDEHVQGKPVVVDLESSIKKYSDLALFPDQETILATAVVRESFSLFTPSVTESRVQLAIPYLMPGSADVRRGNMLAIAGRWSEAQSIWESVYQSHPNQIAALHNLAVAAVAAQDFTRAKQLIRSAIGFQSNALHKETLAWIELRQRDYHRAFALPDPPEGWFVTTGEQVK